MVSAARWRVPADGRRATPGRRPKTFLSVVGPVRLERACYHCDACHAGTCPRDRALGLEGTSLSPGVTRMVGLAAAEVSFAKASELLGALAGIRVESKQVERTAEALGREVAADERAVTESPLDSPPTMYLGLDGTGVPVRCLRGRRAPRQAARRLRQDPRGQARHPVDGRSARQAGPARTRRRVGQLQRRGRERGQPRHRPLAIPLRATRLP